MLEKMATTKMNIRDLKLVTVLTRVVETEIIPSRPNKKTLLVRQSDDCDLLMFSKYCTYLKL